MPAIEQSDSEKVDDRLERVQFEVKYKSVLETKDDEEEEVNVAGKDAGKATIETVADETKHLKPDDTKEEIEPASGIETPPTRPQDIATDNENDKDKDNDFAAIEKSTKKKKKIFRSDDPISWYGILVPSSLKNAQKSFIEAVDGGIPQIVSVMREMRCVEDMVYELRREIDGEDEAN